MLEDAEDAVREANAELLRVRADIFRKENKLPKASVREKEDSDEGTNEQNDMPEMLPSVDKEDGSHARSIDIEEGLSLGTASDETGLRKRAVPSAHAKYKMAQSLVNQVQSVSSRVGKAKNDTRSMEPS
ncbi:MAG: hypothetical protein SGARI_003950 [Bacillariaceae sp.]